MTDVPGRPVDARAAGTETPDPCLEAVTIWLDTVLNDNPVPVAVAVVCIWDAYRHDVSWHEPLVHFLFLVAQVRATMVPSLSAPDISAVAVE